MTYKLGFILICSLTTLSYAADQTDALLAQCTIDAHSDTGRNFIKDNGSKVDRDSAYRNWMLLCMKSKGFVYSNQRCPFAKDGATRASEARCFEKM